MSLLDEIEAAQDVATETITIPGWGVTLEFRGMTFESLQAMQESIDLQAAESGNLDAMIDMLALTAYDPATGKPVFNSERGKAVLRKKSYQALLYAMQNGAQVVLGVDKAETAGKDSSSTETASPTADADSSSQ